jgi:hypothetical protein
MKPKALRKADQKTIRAKRTGRGFEKAIARMAADLVLRAECAAITKDFRLAESDGLTLVLDWAAEHRHELMEDWNLCSQLKPPKAIEPLK